MTEEIHGYIDFDGTLTTLHSHYKLHRKGASLDPVRRWPILLWYGSLCIAKDMLCRENKSELEKLATVLEGLRFSETDDLVGMMTINLGLQVVRNTFPGSDSINLVVLTKNDEDLVKKGICGLQLRLENLFGINIIGVIGNHYHKNDGIYTGKVEISVEGNKSEFFEGKYFFGDAQDGWRYSSYDKFVKVPKIK